MFKHGTSAAMSVQFAELIIIGSAGAYVYDQEVFAR